MLGDGKWNSGDQGSFYKYQFGVLKLLEQINAGIAGLPGIDYELIYTSYKTTATVGGCYNLGDFVQRVDIINAATGAISSTVWYNETLGTILVGACIPPIGNLTPYIPPSNITVNNPFNLEATQLLVKAKTDNLDVLLSTRASAANQTNGTQLTGVNNGAGAAAVNIQDGGNSITVDGTVSSSNLPATVDTNFGVPGASTIRVAAQLGNGASAADFNAGVTTAQTLRVVLPTNQSAIPVTQSTSPWVVSGTVVSNEDKNYGVVGANTLRTAAQIGNALGAADFNAGVAGAQTLRVVLSDPNTATPQTITSIIAVAAGSVAAGATSVGFTTDAAFAGTINGALITRTASTFYGFEAAAGRTLAAIPYTVTAGSITIDSIA